tara:strand:+ start:383 stop:622 length:240 start_codon:yes stop_codon:yes gene_type:complete
MKSEKIPADIKAKSVKEAQDEIKQIIDKLENSSTNLEESMSQYQRMMQLNTHILEQFKTTSKKIKDVTFKDKKNKLNQN